MQAVVFEPRFLWHLHKGEGPVVGTAVHAGHELRPELMDLLAIDEKTRLREEDPFSDYWTLACHTQLVARRSRFEVDLNRRPEEAICIQPEDCWNLTVWRNRIGGDLVDRSLAEHAAFYEMFDRLLKDVVARYGKVVVFDFHTYNHRRVGPDAPPEEPADNPEINVGTGSMDRSFWAPVVDRFCNELRAFDFSGRHLDVRENVKFRGRYLPQYIHASYPKAVCVLAIEVKKFFMDEWTGEADGAQIEALMQAFSATVPGVVEELEHL